MPKGSYPGRRGRPLRRRYELRADLAQKVVDLAQAIDTDPEQIINDMVREATMEYPVSYRIGQLLARLEASGAADRSRDYELVIESPASRIPILIKELVRLGRMDDITPIMASIPAIPDTLSNEQQSSFALGFYQEKGRITRRE